MFYGNRNSCTRLYILPLYGLHFKDYFCSQVNNDLQKRGQMTKSVEQQQFDPTITYIKQTVRQSIN